MRDRCLRVIAADIAMPDARAIPLQHVVLVTGLSGAGKGSILHVFEDLDFETVDNPPLDLLENMVLGTDRNFAVGVDARTRGFDQTAVLATIERLRAKPALRCELLYAWANQTALLRRYTETRRRHPMAAHGRVIDGIAAEERLTTELRAAADLVIDTSNLPLPALRRMIEQQFGSEPGTCGAAGLTVTLTSFAFPNGLPAEADMIFDARFLRNPHYDPALRPLTGLDPAVGAFVESDPDYAHFEGKVACLLDLVLPRFVQEGKKYATIAIGCTGGRHRSVHTVEKLATHLRTTGWRVAVTHREIAEKQREIAEKTREIADTKGERTASDVRTADPAIPAWTGVDRRTRQPASPQEA
jgi:UPF0042 nucleotide-binding protein